MTTEAKKVSFSTEIINGPSVSKIADAFKYAFDKDPMTAIFTMNESVRIRFRVLSIEYLDKSGVSLSLNGCVSSIIIQRYGKDHTIRTERDVNLQISYNTSTRKGIAYLESVHDLKIIAMRKWMYSDEEMASLSISL